MKEIAYPSGSREIDIGHQVFSIIHLNVHEMSSVFLLCDLFSLRSFTISVTSGQLGLLSYTIMNVAQGDDHRATLRSHNHDYIRESSN